jgi:hypothetical protein
MQGQKRQKSCEQTLSPYNKATYMRKIVSDYGKLPVTAKRFIRFYVSFVPEGATAVGVGHPREFSSRRGFAAILKEVIVVLGRREIHQPIRFVVTRDAYSHTQSFMAYTPAAQQVQVSPNLIGMVGAPRPAVKRKSSAGGRFRGSGGGGGDR